MADYIGRGSRALAWLLMVAGFALVGTTCLHWFGQLARAETLDQAPTLIPLVGGVLAGYASYALGLFVMVQGARLQRRLQRARRDFRR